MPAEPAVVIERLRVLRGGRAALDDLSAILQAGVVTGLLGPSGSGKSTLIRSIVGVQVIASGSVRVFGLEASSANLRGAQADGLAEQVAHSLRDHELLARWNDLDVELPE